MYQAEANDPRDDYAGSVVPADVAEFLSPFSSSYDARRSLGDAGSGSGNGMGLFMAEDADVIVRDDAVEGLGGMGWIQFIPAAIEIGKKTADALSSSGSGGDQLEAITDQVPPSSINAYKGSDGWWYDLTTNAQLSHDEASKRQHAYIAALIGATVQPDGYWRRNGQVLSHDQAYQLYQQVVTGVANTGTPNPPTTPQPAYPVTYTPAAPATPTYPVTYPGPQYPAGSGPTGAAPMTAGFGGISSKNLMLGAAALAAVVVLPKLFRGRA